MSKNPQSDPSKETNLTEPNTLEEVPPVIIKGGSLKVLLSDGDNGFDDPDNHTKVKQATHPNPNIKIFKVEIHDNRVGEQDRLLSFYDATDVDGHVDVLVFAE